ncbi:hypothetical protein LXL04_016907 [Taraxacum kok-saghyz]
MVRMSMFPDNVELNEFKLTAFPFMLEDQAREWDAETFTTIERFNNLYTNCSQHQILEQLLLQQFIEGLKNQDKRMIDVSSGGDFQQDTIRNKISFWYHFSKSKKVWT